ncbi:uncharacterized protein PHALS_00746 [Plasmopara halstedii]|uniref:Uncharacterized protein n=1 Tax=Plasmopara halstedii TaxID=4781 RepID=A0A0P1ARX9_PLAHL|nr:uncharacterized protein PHALS_00746 [Plasmopara halstedii]CEG44378.1 hypothetical protein PHALS_00746 [Plasmopara halstedii]|eukprot:XP_024580747.1 hypothetical protein PHALS_00746 [Plasmopara halstedii]
MTFSHVRAVMALSTAGMLLVPAFGLLLRFQPQFVHGLHANPSSAEINCYIAGSLYAGIHFVCSLLLVINFCIVKTHETLDDATRRNQRFGLPFKELESEEFVKAMDTLDQRIAVTPTFYQTLELSEELLANGDTI